MHKAKRVFLKRYNVVPNVRVSEAIREVQRFFPTFSKRVQRKHNIRGNTKNNE